MIPRMNDIHRFGIRTVTAAALELVGVMLADHVFGSEALTGEFSNERRMLQPAPHRCDLVSGTPAGELRSWFGRLRGHGRSIKGAWKDRLRALGDPHNAQYWWGRNDEGQAKMICEVRGAREAANLYHSSDLLQCDQGSGDLTLSESVEGSCSLSPGPRFGNLQRSVKDEDQPGLEQGRREWQPRLLKAPGDQVVDPTVNADVHVSAVQSGHRVPGTLRAGDRPRLPAYLPSTEFRWSLDGHSWVEIGGACTTDLYHPPVPPHTLGRFKSLKRLEFLSLVPGRGLEPPRCYPLVPETSASTNSATRAGKGRRRNLRTGYGAVN